ncbi:MAG: aspartyl-phosphate phosphatase Spo0E family protein [bacterium]
MSKSWQETNDGNHVLVQEMESLRNQLHLMIQEDRQNLVKEEVYRMSLRLDRLIVQYMRAYA